MALAGIHSTDAKRFVRIAQFAGVGLGVLAAALWVMDVPGLSQNLPAKPQPRADLGGETPAATTLLVARIEPESTTAMQERLDMAVNRPPPPKPDPKGETEPPPVILPAGGPAWRYLGAIRESTRMLALVSIDGAQKFVSVGSKITQKTPAAEGRPESTNYQATVKDVQADFIEIEENGGKVRRIDLDARTAKVSWVKNMSVASAGTAMPNAAMSAETRQRLQAQGIDPMAAERVRQAALTASGAGRNRALPNTPGSTNPLAPVTTVVGTGLAQPKVTPASDDVTSSRTKAANDAATIQKHRSDAETQN